MTPMASPIAKASSWSCVTNSAVACAAFRMPRTSCARRSRRSTSRLENGSSSSSSCAAGAPARGPAPRAAAGRRTVHADSALGAGGPTRSSTSATRVARWRGAGCGCRSRRSAPHPGAETARSPGTPCRCAAARGQRAARAADHLATEADLAGTHRLQPGDGAQQGGLAAAGRADQHADLAGPQAERRPADCGLRPTGVVHIELANFQEHEKHCR
jgi:hypothetical protein